MVLRFHFERALQASACLLRLDGKRMAYLRLLKLLYIADREWLAETGESIYWRSRFRDEERTRPGEYLRPDQRERLEGRCVGRLYSQRRLCRCAGCGPGRGALSKGIVNKLTEITERYRQLDDWELSERTHEFQEWTRHYSPEGVNGDDSLAGHPRGPGQGRYDLRRRA